MQGYGGAGNKATDQYLVQRIQGASPEMLVAMLLEGAQKFINQALTAMEQRDLPTKARFVNRVSAIIEELTVWLNMEGGGELAINLARIYEWWTNELFDASQKGEPERLIRIRDQMGEIRSSWEELDRRNRKETTAPVAPSLDNLMG